MAAKLALEHITKTAKPSMKRNRRDGMAKLATPVPVIRIAENCSRTAGGFNVHKGTLHGCMPYAHYFFVINHLR